MIEKDPTENRFLSGFVAIVGRPNVGKSTLLNQLSGTRVAIVSPKPQTTRHNIRAIIDEPDAQIIFIDTPGIHKPRTKLGEFMVDSAYNAFGDADVLVLMIDATAPRITETEKNCCEKAGKMKKPLILLVNKVDLIPKEELFPIIERFTKLYAFDTIIPISVKKNDGLDILKKEIKKHLPEGPQYFPPDSITDQTERHISSELIREQILRMTNEEIPHGTAVEIELFEERFSDAKGEILSKEKIGMPDECDFTISGCANDETYDEEETEEEIDEDAKDENKCSSVSEETGEREFVRIKAVIYCEKDSHKRIIIGKKGEMIKRIGIQARRQIEDMLQCKIYLELFVKVREDWRNRNPILDNLGYKNLK
jgi:GTP-binding protein Era